MFCDCEHEEIRVPYKWRRRGNQENTHVRLPCWYLQVIDRQARASTLYLPHSVVTVASIGLLVTTFAWNKSCFSLCYFLGLSGSNSVLNGTPIHRGPRVFHQSTWDSKYSQVSTWDSKYSQVFIPIPGVAWVLCIYIFFSLTMWSLTVLNFRTALLASMGLLVTAFALNKSCFSLCYLLGLSDSVLNGTPISPWPERIELEI